jgi:hypothetical protein
MTELGQDEGAGQLFGLTLWTQTVTPCVTSSDPPSSIRDSRRLKLPGYAPGEGGCAKKHASVHT